MPSFVRHLHLAPLVAAAILLACVQPAAAQSEAEAADLARHLRERIEQLHTLRAQHRAGVESREAQLDQLTAQVGRLERQLAPAEQRLAQQQADVAAAEAALNEVEARRADAAALAQSLGEHALPVLQAAVERTVAGIPYQQEPRKQQMQAVYTRLSTDDPAERLGALSDLMVLLAEELRLGKSRELFNAPVVINDGQTRVNAYQLRLGLVQHYFVSEDKAHVGMASPDGRWQVVTDSDQRAAIIHALEVAQEQRPPGLYEAPFLDK